MTNEKWIVHKFGGTSVGSIGAIRQVLELLESQRDQKIAVVVSAMSGVTDRLIRAAHQAAAQDRNYEETLEQLLKDHTTTAVQLLNAKAAEIYNDSLVAEMKDLREILRGVWLARFLPETTLEMVSGYGELWSSRLVAALWRVKKADVAWLDAREVLVVESGDTGPLLEWPLCQDRFDRFLVEQKSSHLVITGFIASTPGGVPTTLKRNGSDFSASIFGRLLNAREIVIWTDVDGVYSADPRRVPEAECLDEISYEEAIELAYFGAKVIHPHTMGPAVELGIPILIKNTFNSSAPGTYIHRVQKTKNGKIARGFTTVDNISLINVEGTGMIGVPGVAQRLFGGLREVGVSVVLISQASSEHSICFAVPSNQTEKAERVLNKVFHSELAYRQIEKIQTIPHCSILAMVGDNMVEKSGVAGRFFAALGQAGVSVRAIAQGSSERNISVVINQADATRALRATHSAFFLSDYTFSVGLIGPGLIGKAFLKQLAEQKSFLKSNFNLDVRVRAIANSQKMKLEPREISLTDEISDLAESWRGADESLDFQKLSQHIRSEGIPHSVIIDCTSSEEVASHYPEWLGQGIHIITPNKKAGSGDLKRFLQVRTQQKLRNTHFFYEATVGAGLPIISTLRDLMQTGDSIISIEGLFSGTLSYLFSEFTEGKKFSDIVLKAKQNGFTEPDPREDLNGIDVARKVVILAREAGFTLNLDDVDIESLVPPSLASHRDTEAFLARVSEMDDVMTERLLEAQKQGLVLRYTGYVSAAGKAHVGLRAFSQEHAFARLKGTDNMIAFRTQRYDQQPLIVQGPGAGPEVTAGGIFGDLLRLARNLGTKA